jgi:3',5'-cyclic AMP phosphodiesterase CpdA
MLLGDIQYPKGALSDFRSSFEQSWGGLKKFLRPVPGNHEYATPKAAGYYNFFGARAGDPKAGYYSFNASGWHFVALNSNCGSVSCAAGSDQVKWLHADLAKNHRKCVAAFWHEPLFSSGQHGNSPVVRPFWSELRRAGAEIVLNGHDHDYERFAPQDENGRLDRKRGVREFVVGTGGRSHYAIDTRQPNSQFATANEFGVLALDLTRRGMKWRFVTTRGETLDRGSTRCH